MAELLLNTINKMIDIGFLLLVVVLFVILYVIQKTSYKSYYIYPSSIDVDFQDSVRHILNNSKIHNRYKIQETDDLNSADITIRLTPRSELTSAHSKNEYYKDGTLIRFSFTYKYAKPKIYIDHINWMHGVPQSGLTLNQYRKYVIQHEFMHALGFDHQPCNEKTATDGICPIMYQSTRGAPDGYKCGFDVTDVDYTKTF
jgi:hypothetical protein